MKPIIFFLLFVLSFSTLYSQKQKIKFGEITEEELSITSCPFDPNAGAMVLSDIGSLRYEISNTSGVDLIIERHIRIKILNSTGYDAADIAIECYTGQGSNVTLTQVKAQTIIPDGTTFTIHKVDKKEMFNVRENEYYSNLKFSFPKVDDGNIVEYKYRLTTPYQTSMKQWEFQREIPVLYTEYEARIPEYYTCSVTLEGHNTEVVQYNKTAYTSNRMHNNVHFFKATNLPAMPSERYGTNIHNYTTKARFVISGVRIPGYVHETFAGDYMELNKTIMEVPRFKQIERKHNHLESALEEIKRSDQIKSDLYHIVEYVRSKTTFNNHHYLYPSQEIKATLNGADANS